MSFDPDHLLEIIEHSGQEENGEPVHPLRVFEMATELGNAKVKLELISNILAFEGFDDVKDQEVSKEELLLILDDILNPTEYATGPVYSPKTVEYLSRFIENGGTNNATLH